MGRCVARGGQDIWTTRFQKSWLSEILSDTCSNSIWPIIDYLYAILSLIVFQLYLLFVWISGMKILQYKVQIEKNTIITPATSLKLLSELSTLLQPTKVSGLKILINGFSGWNSQIMCSLSFFSFFQIPWGFITLIHIIASFIVVINLWTTGKNLSNKSHQCDKNLFP